MAWYILYPKVHGSKKRCALRKTKPIKPVAGYGFAEGPLSTLEKVSWRLNWMNIPASKRPMRHGKVI